MAWFCFAALDGTDIVAQGGFSVPLTYLLTASNQVVDGFRTLDGTLRRVYDRKPETLLADIDLAADQHCPCKGYWVMHRPGAPVPGAESFLAPAYLRTREIEALARYGDPNFDVFSVMLAEQNAARHPSTPPAQNNPTERLKTGDCPTGVRGMLQAFVPSGVQHATFCVKWSARVCSHPTCEIIARRADATCGSEADRQELKTPQCWRISCSVNSMAWRSPLAKRSPLYCSFSTFDAAEGMCTRLPVSSDEAERLMRAVSFLRENLSRKQHGHEVSHLTAHFALRNSTLVLLFVQRLEFFGTVKPSCTEIRVPLQFSQLLHESGGRGFAVRARHHAIFPEDLVASPSIKDIYRCRSPAVSSDVKAPVLAASSNEGGESQLLRDTRRLLGTGESIEDIWLKLETLEPGSDAAQRPGSPPRRVATPLSVSRDRSGPDHTPHKEQGLTHPRSPRIHVNEEKKNQRESEGRKRRIAAEIIQDASALLAVLEGRRALDPRLVRVFGLKAAQRAFLCRTDNQHRPPPNKRKHGLASKGEPPGFDSRSSVLERAALFQPSVSRAGAEKPSTLRPQPLRRRLPVTKPPPSNPRSPSRNATPHYRQQERRGTCSHEAVPTEDNDGGDLSLSTLSSPLSSGADFKELEGFAYRPTTAGTELASEDSVGFDDGMDADDPYTMMRSVALRPLVDMKTGTSVAARLEELDRLSGTVSDLTSRIEELIALPLPDEVVGHEPSYNKVMLVQAGLRLATEFMTALPYQIEAFLLGERALPGKALRGADISVSGADPDAPLGDRASVLLFSVPPRMTPNIERRIIMFLRSLPAWFTPVDSVEVRAMMRDPNLIVHHLYDTELFASYLRQYDTAEEASPRAPVFGLRMPPALGDLSYKARDFVLRVLRSYYLERLDEAAEEGGKALASTSAVVSRVL